MEDFFLEQMEVFGLKFNAIQSSLEFKITYKTTGVIISACTDDWKEGQLSINIIKLSEMDDFNSLLKRHLLCLRV